MSAVLSDRALSWLRDSERSPAPSRWVPGASVSELVSLGGLGALCRSVIVTAAFDVIPSDLSEWMIVEDVPRWLRSEFLEGVRRSGDRYLSAVYACLVAPQNRRRLGTFFTPPEEVKAVLELWDASQVVPDEIVDLGAGVGAFTFAAAQRWPSSRVVAIDINPITLGLLYTQYRVGLDEVARAAMADIEFVLADFSSWIGSHPADPSKSRLVIGNPPYTRAALLPVEERRRLNVLAGGLCGSRANLATLMTAISILELSRSDGLCLVLPTNWLEADYAQGLRDYLWVQLNRRVEVQMVQSSMFADARVDAVVLLVGAEHRHPGLVTGVWRGARSVVTRGPVRPTGWRPGPKGVAIGSVVGVAGAGIDRPKSCGAPDRVLSDYVSIARGVATGANSYFVLPPDVAAEMPLEYRHKIATRFRYLSEVSGGTSLEKWVLACGEDDVTRSEFLSQYLSIGLSQKIHERHLCAARKVWFDLRREIYVPDLVVSSMSRGQFQIALNSDRRAITNNLYGFSWKSDVSNELRHSILRWFKSPSGQSAFQSVARRRGDGLLKLELSELRAMKLDGFV